jgi:hypothetical protein
MTGYATTTAEDEHIQLLAPNERPFPRLLVKTTATALGSSATSPEPLMLLQKLANHTPSLLGSRTPLSAPGQVTTTSFCISGIPT